MKISTSSNSSSSETNLYFFPLPITENRAGNYDKYLRITLYHIKKIKKYLSSNQSQCPISSQKNFENILDKNKKILLLDLDETLIHSDFFEELEENKIDSNKYDAIISFYTSEDPNINNTNNNNNITDNNTTDDESKDDSCEKVLNKVGIFIRPKLKEFLEEISKYFLIGVFTAAIPEYADAAINYLDPEEKYIKFKLYRNDCINIGDLVRIKDLKIFGVENLDKIVLLDNNIYSFSNQLSNGILINSFFNDENDDELSNVRKYLIDYIFPCDDVRKINEQFFGFETILKNFVN